MASLLLLSALASAWLIFLVVERISLDRHRRAIPLRIAVTGTRGKTTVTRKLAAVLSADGRRVLAKTTGSEAAYLFPDGSIHEIHRLGAPSIIEQKRLLRRGAKLGADVVLAEVMSVHPENHLVEVQRILQPHLVLVTNFRVDHIEAQGRTRREVASVLSLDVPSGARALVPEQEMEERFRKLVSEAGGEVVAVPSGTGRLYAEGLSGVGDPPGRSGEFGPNQDLVWAAARAVGVTDEVIRDGIRNYQEDLGALKSWEYVHQETGASWVLVNAFAANDPESTLGIYRRLTEAEGVGSDDCVGLLSLRSDRGDRSLQWAETLEAGALSSFRRLFLAGLHAPAVRHRLRRHPLANRLRILRPGTPEETMARLLGGEGDAGGLLFGFGNIDGLGRTLVGHWKKAGRPHGN